MTYDSIYELSTKIQTFLKDIFLVCFEHVENDLQNNFGTINTHSLNLFNFAGDKGLSARWMKTRSDYFFIIFKAKRLKKKSFWISLKLCTYELY